jgi:hypothetical protein
LIALFELFIFELLLRLIVCKASATRNRSRQLEAHRVHEAGLTRQANSQSGSMEAVSTIAVRIYDIGADGTREESLRSKTM